MLYVNKLKRHTTYNIVLELGFIWVWVLDTYQAEARRPSVICITVIDTIIHHILHMHNKDAYILVHLPGYTGTLCQLPARPPCQYSLA
jgi:hypothetical protein